VPITDPIQRRYQCLDDWLASRFARGNMAAPIDELADSAAVPTGPSTTSADVKAKLAECDRTLPQYRAALDAGGDPAVIVGWISETEAARALYKSAAMPDLGPAMSRDEIAALVESLADLPALLRDADPADKAGIYAGIGLRLTYQPGPRAVFAEVKISEKPHWHIESARGGSTPYRSMSYSTDIDLQQVAGRIPSDVQKR
jgi:site-specific DNA recombinase